jgi:hypothetical protein
MMADDEGVAMACRQILLTLFTELVLHVKVVLLLLWYCVPN